MLPVTSVGHAAYQQFVVEMFRKYYPNPDAIARSNWDIIDRFWYHDLSYTDICLKDKYSVSVLDPELLPLCTVPICFLLIFSDFHH